MMKKQKNDLQNYFASKNFIVGLLIFALVAQMPTTAYFFKEIQLFIKPEFPVYLNWSLGVCYALVAELAMFAWVVNGNEKMSWVYCFVTILINLSQLFNVWNEMSVFFGIGGVFMSAVLPVSIAMFSKEFVKGGSGTVEIEEEIVFEKAAKKDKKELELSIDGYELFSGNVGDEMVVFKRLKHEG
jgi:hypothetical protein